MNVEAYINKIIEETGLTRNEIKNRVEEKKNELKGLISEEGALFIIAKELGVDVKEENKELLKDIEINISDIIPNMKNITLIGRIKQVNRVFSFNKKDGGSGNVGSFILHDNSGEIRIVLWDDHTLILENPEFEKNELVKILNGYARKGKTDETEVHIGRLGKIIIAPEDVDYKKYPKIKDEFIMIEDINLSLPSVSIEGKIMQIFPTKEFTRKTGEIGKVSSLTLMDSTGSTKITFWNEDTEKINDLKVDDTISITNLNPKLSSLDAKSIDLYITRNSIITKLDKKLKIEGEFIENIKKVQEKRGLISLQGVVSSVDNLKKVNTKSGEDTYLLGFIISDESDWIRMTVWGEKAEELSDKLIVGKGILLKNVLVKYSSFSNRNELSLLNDSNLEFIDLKIKNLKESEIPIRKLKSNFTQNYTKIIDINSPDFFEIKGFIAKEIRNNDLILYDACSNCRKKVDNCTCDGDQSIQKNLILKIFIDDGSETIKATFFGDKAEGLIGLKAEDVSSIVDIENFLENLSKELMGRDLIIRGKSVFNDYNQLNKYEINVFDFKDLDVNSELEFEIKELETL